MALRLGSFAWDTIDEQAARDGLTVEQLVTFSVLYYLADLDSGRVSRRISKSPYPQTPNERSTGGAADHKPATIGGQRLSDRHERPSDAERQQSTEPLRDLSAQS